MKILIADDTTQTRELIKEVLQFTKHTFIECNNGLSAIEIYNNSHPDLVLMDISMPKINGLDASKKILQKNPTAKIIIVTQYKEPSLMDEAKRIGTAGYLLKDNLHEIAEYIENRIQTKIMRTKHPHEKGK